MWPPVLDHLGVNTNYAIFFFFSNCAIFLFLKFFDVLYVG